MPEDSPRFRFTLMGALFLLAASALIPFAAWCAMHVPAAEARDDAFRHTQDQAWSACLHDSHCDLDRLAKVQEWDRSHRDAEVGPWLMGAVFSGGIGLISLALAVLRLSPCLAAAFKGALNASR